MTTAAATNPAAISGFQNKSIHYSELDQEVISNLRFAGQYKPMLSGSLSPNPQTGKIRVDYDQTSMSIVVVRDNELEEASQIMKGHGTATSVASP